MNDQLAFSGTEGLTAPQFIQAVRRKVFGDDNRHRDDRYMAEIASLCFTGEALEWYENLEDGVQTDWSVLRRALLARFPSAGLGQTLLYYKLLASHRLMQTVTIQHDGTLWFSMGRRLATTNPSCPRSAAVPLRKVDPTTISGWRILPPVV